MTSIGPSLGGASGSATVLKASGPAPDLESPRTSRAALLVLAAIVASGLALRLVGFGTPITGVRETQSAMIARNLLADGPRGLLYPRLDYGGDQPGYAALEVPIVNALGAAALALFPSAGDPVLKLPSLLFYLLATYFLFDLARRRLGLSAALFAAALFALLPLNTEMSASPLPEEAALALSVGAIALLDRFLVSGRLSTGIVSFALLALALLVKSTYLFIAVPMAALVVTRLGIRGLFRPRFLALWALGLVPLALWLGHSKAVNSSSELFGAGRTVEDANLSWLFQKGRLDYYGSGAWYLKIGERLAKGNTLAGVTLAAFGFVLLSLRRRDVIKPLVAWWGISIGIYCIAVPFQVYTHPYYLLPAAPLLALMGGLALDRIGARLGFQAFPYALGIALLVPVAVEGPPNAIAGLRSSSPAKVAFGEAARRVVPPDALMIVSAYSIRSWDGSLFYQARRRGWKFSSHLLDESDPEGLRELSEARRKRGALGHGRHAVPPSADARFALTPEKLEELRGRGAKFLAYFGSPAQWVDDGRDLATYVLARYPAALVEPEWLFVDLRQPFDRVALEPPPDGSSIPSSSPSPETGRGLARFALAGTAEAPDSLDERRRKLFAWRVGEGPEGEPLPVGGSAPLAGLIPARAFAPGAVLLELRAVGGGDGKKSP